MGHLMTPFLALFDIGAPEIFLIVLVFVLLFGATKIPQLARTLGRAKGDFEKGKLEGERELATEQDEVATIRRARELGIPTDGRAIAEIRKDIQAKAP